VVVTVEGQPPRVELKVIMYVLETEAERSIVPELEFENTKPVGEAVKVPVGDIVPEIVPETVKLSVGVGSVPDVQ
jgi:hypothetical protein